MRSFRKPSTRSQHSTPGDTIHHKSTNSSQMLYAPLPSTSIPRPNSPVPTVPQPPLDPIIISTQSLIKPLLPVRLANPCSLCDRSFLTRHQLRKHTKNSHPYCQVNSYYICSDCGHHFKCRQSLREHFVRKHTEGFRFECASCPRKFKMKSDLYMHVQSQHNQVDSEVVCEACGKTYRNRFALKKHLAHSHNTRPFPCNMCNRKLATRESLEQHVLLHAKKRSPACQLCGKTFSGNDALKKHMRIHTDTRPFTCEVCGKRFRRQNTHKQHMLTHTGVKPYVCDICVHRRRHAGNYSHRCDVCGAGFMQRSKYAEHRALHDAGGPDNLQRCHICFKSFNYKRNLQAHLEHCHQPAHKPIECPQCPSSFSRQAALDRHRSRCHANSDGDTIAVVKIEPEVLAELEIINLLGRELGNLAKPVTELTKIFSCKECNAHFPSEHLLDKHCDNNHPASPASNDVPDTSEEPLPPPSPCAEDERIKFRGYHKNVRTGYFFCNFCTYSSSSQAAVRVHSTRLHWDLIEDDGTTEDLSESDKKKSRKRKLDTGDKSSSNGAFDSVSFEDKVKILQIFFQNPSDEFARNCPCCFYRTEKRSNFKEHVRRMHKDMWQACHPPKPPKSPRKSKSDDAKEGETPTEQTEKNGVEDEDEDNGWWSKLGEQPKQKKPVSVAQPETKAKRRRVNKNADGSTEPRASKKKHKCITCESEFNSVKALNKHISTDHPEVRLENLRKKRLVRWASTGYACHHCSFVGSTVESTGRHSRKNHSLPMAFVQAIPATSFNCHHCYFTCDKRKDMQTHTKTHRVELNETGVYDCSLCNFSSTSRECLQRHITVKHERPAVYKSEPQECKSCDYTCLNSQVMEWHKKQHDPTQEDFPEQLSCNECKFLTWNKFHLASHMRKRHKDLFGKADDIDGNDKEDLFSKITNENGEMVYSCHVCEYFSPNKWVLRIHTIRKHTHGRNFECEQCGKRYNLKSDLSNHVRTTHDVQKSVMCDVCGKVCRNSHGLHVHQKNKHFRPKFPCPHCPKRMVTQANLDDHVLRQHEQKQDYICEECGKIFKDAHRLRLHMPVHTGARPWKCTICTSAFGRRNGLRQHLLTHSKEKPYTCDVCGKSFTQKTGLICHRKSHKGPLPPLPPCPRAVIDRVIRDLLGENESSEINEPDDQAD
ncbi:hypothetical protein QAD02_010895 [Eretmocerus hayati]|uniref:Uncharacterized protein n=1 Tax=Eretmocerus hayati TaxID=131215 RepID=A0ACC2NXT6_9HYME|nr:hypothetical protein QAD02_010895 [Eretmocerus hayati]